MEVPIRGLEETDNNSSICKIHARDTNCMNYKIHEKIPKVF